MHYIGLSRMNKLNILPENANHIICQVHSKQVHRRDFDLGVMLHFTSWLFNIPRLSAWPSPPPNSQQTVMVSLAYSPQKYLHIRNGDGENSLLESKGKTHSGVLDLAKFYWVGQLTSAHSRWPTQHILGSGQPVDPTASEFPF